MKFLLFSRSFGDNETIYNLESVDKYAGLINFVVSNLVHKEPPYYAGLSL